jgi:hypothetical protein
MKRLLPLASILAASGLGLSACADYLAVDSEGHTTAEPPKAAASAPPAKGDTCHAAALQYLVGKNKAEAPAPVDPSGRRVYCSTCAVTLDYRPDRLDIEFDEATGTITAVKCG